MISSMALADMVLNGGEAEQQRYLGLLKAGGSRYSMDILKTAGVDMTTTSPHEAAYKQFDQIVAEMEKIYERLKAKGLI
jgi:oligoendopeptidase F